MIYEDLKKLMSKITREEAAGSKDGIGKSGKGKHKSKKSGKAKGNGKTPKGLGKGGGGYFTRSRCSSASWGTVRYLWGDGRSSSPWRVNLERR